MRTLLLIAIVGTSLTASAGWKDWTEQQRVAVKNWIKTQPTRDTVKLQRAIVKRTVIEWNDWDENVPFDPITVLYRREAKRIAGLAGIVKADTDVEMDGKLQAYIADAAAGDKPLAVYNAGKFWVAFNAVRDVDADQSATYVVHHHEPVAWSDSIAQENALGSVTGEDIESAERHK